MIDSMSFDGETYKVINLGICIQLPGDCRFSVIRSDRGIIGNKNPILAAKRIELPVFSAKMSIRLVFGLNTRCTVVEAEGS